MEWFFFIYDRERMFTDLKEFLTNVEFLDVDKNPFTFNQVKKYFKIILDSYRLFQQFFKVHVIINNNN